MTKSTLIHLRFPFSYFLMPVFMLSLATSNHVIVWKAVLSFIIIHLFLFTASNGFNSYYDRDTESIGGIEKPPVVTPDLLWVTLLFDLIAVILAFIISPIFSLGIFLYGIGSKLYSWDQVRLKRKPIVSWLAVGFFQGFIIFVLSYGSFDSGGYSGIIHSSVYLPAILCSLFMLGAYPMTQIYQHREDRRRGDRTISMLLGIRGTFILTSIVFLIVLISFVFYY
ncbi:MAG TPA: UbiA family prenyltransferase, partial [Spirochaetota bacterium]